MPKGTCADSKRPALGHSSRFGASSMRQRVAAAYRYAPVHQLHGTMKNSCQRSRNSDLYGCHDMVSGIAAHSVS